MGCGKSKPAAVATGNTECRRKSVPDAFGREGNSVDVKDETCRSQLDGERTEKVTASEEEQKNVGESCNGRECGDESKAIGETDGGNGVDVGSPVKCVENKIVVKEEVGKEDGIVEQEHEDYEMNACIVGEEVVVLNVASPENKNSTEGDESRVVEIPESMEIKETSNEVLEGNDKFETSFPAVEVHQSSDEVIESLNNDTATTDSSDQKEVVVAEETEQNVEDGVLSPSCLTAGESPVNATELHQAEKTTAEAAEGT